MEVSQPFFQDQAVRLVLTKCWPSGEVKEADVDFPLIVSHNLLKKLARKGIVLNLATEYVAYFAFETKPGFMGLFRTEIETQQSELNGTRTNLRLFYGNELVVVWSCARFKYSSCNLRGGLILGIEGDKLDASDNRFFLSEPQDPENPVEVGPKHDILVKLDTDMSFINEIGLLKEEGISGITFPRFDFYMSGIDAKMVYLKVKRSEGLRPTRCPFIISNGVFKARRGMRFFYLEGLSDGMVDVILGKEVMSLLGTMVTLQENYVIFRSKRDSRMERTVYFGLKPASMDLGVRASDNVLFHMHDPTIGQ